MTAILRNIEGQFAGDPFALTVTADSDVSAIDLVCTVRRYQNGPVIASRSTSDGGIVVAGGTDVSVLFGSDETELWPIGTIWYDLQADPSAIESYTIVEGRITTKRRITITRTLAPPPITAALSASIGTISLSASAGTLNSGELAASIGTITLSSQGASNPPALDAFTTAPRAAYSVWRRLLTSYTGPLIRVRDATTTTLTDIGYDAADNLLDEAALAGAVTTHSWRIPTLYDQATGARNLTQGTLAAMPVGGLSGTAHLIGTHHAMAFDGVDEQITRADALGLSGAVALSTFAEFSLDGSFPFAQPILSIGTLAANQIFSVFASSDTSVVLSISGSSRTFTAPSMGTTGHKIVTALAAGAGIGTARCWLDGVELAQSAVSNGSNTLNLGTTGFALGNTVGGTSFYDGEKSEAVVWNADFGHASLAGDLALALAL